MGCYIPNFKIFVIFVKIRWFQKIILTYFDPSTAEENLKP